MDFKRRIIPKQLHELSETQKDKLREWWEINQTNYDAMIMSTNLYHSPLPLLDIGQMIELLENKLYKQTGTFGIQKNNNEFCKDIWSLAYGTGYQENENLCDALFEAVKAVI